MAPTSSRLAPPFRELQPIPHATFACGSQTGRDWELGMDMFAVAGWALLGELIIRSGQRHGYSKHGDLGGEAKVRRPGRGANAAT